MAEILDAIIQKGGTTAHTGHVPKGTILEWMHRYPERSAWHIAEDETGNIIGFQFLEPHPDLRPEACDIASFVRVGTTGLGVGSKLFDQSKKTAKELGYAWINATIRADNAGGLAYYQSRGFEDYAHHPNQRLDNGFIVDKVSKRYDLT
ncbi:GNAT family N-acetyltransferase [Marivita sp. XM-24bin2]|jgi:ribosomal protein S18 acetylase RimI-like enzyme|uniref:GNAT family N-acetyltransferase n=1 Tax=unclassified Marivita TaxID=2632480 RepID=UPI0025BB8162|nr:GNAT family N-acetyltransferase [Marivita sp. XM-24bin2]MCR9110158.1 GNAT family N-acetyltransferase [Paracoccaceae bacterium]